MPFKLCRVECRAIFAAAICVVAFAPLLARCNFRGWKHLVPPPPFQKGGRESGASWLEVKCPLTMLGVILYKIKIAKHLPRLNEMTWVGGINNLFRVLFWNVLVRLCRLSEFYPSNIVEHVCGCTVRMHWSAPRGAACPLPQNWVATTAACLLHVILWLGQRRQTFDNRCKSTSLTLHEPVRQQLTILHLNRCCLIQ